MINIYSLQIMVIEEHKFKKKIYVKGRSLLVPDLVKCYSKDTQREWMELSYRRSRGQKYGILKRCINNFSQKRRIQVT